MGMTYNEYSSFNHISRKDFETVKDRGEDDVIAWKEIELPKDIKESE